MSVITKPKHQIVFDYLNQGNGDRTITLYPNNSLQFGVLDGRLHHILYTDTHEIWCKSDMSFNEFVYLCENKTELEMMEMSGNIALTKINRQGREKTRP